MLTAANVDFRADGSVWAPDFGDIYHARAGAAGQAERVFVRGNDLPERWRGRRRFTIVETGFGAGANFLATWQAWRADTAQRCQRLHYIAIEGHPLRPHDLARMHAQWPQWQAHSAALRAAWPPLTRDWHRIHLQDEAIVLDLCWGDIATVLANLRCHADAFYLDGFAPAKNPHMWSPRVCHLLANNAAEGATLATWCVAASVREHLRRARFETRKQSGYAEKRHMLCGQYRGRVRTPLLPSLPPREAVVVGAGLAGCAVAERLAARGWQVQVLEAGGGVAVGASGNHAGVARFHPSLDDNRTSRLSRAGVRYLWAGLEKLQQRDLHPPHARCGVLHVAADHQQAAKMQQVVAALQLPPDVLASCERAQASHLAGWPLAQGGWHFARDGWVQPHALAKALLAAQPDLIETHFHCAVAQLRQAPNGVWQALDDNGRLLAQTRHLILANGAALNQFDVTAALPLCAGRGQVSMRTAAAGSAPQLAVCGGGYVTPVVDGLLCFGATFEVDDFDLQVRAADHAQNIASLEALLPGMVAPPDVAALQGRVGLRPLARDRLPLAGSSGLPAGLAVLGGFGARGLSWGWLMAEYLAAALEGESAPLPQDMARSVDVARFKS